MVESFMHGAYDELFNIFFYEDLLIEDEELYININAISYKGRIHPTDNSKHTLEPETVLDFMYRELNRPLLSKNGRKEIQYLIDFFETEEIDGKRFAELPEAEQQAAWQIRHELVR